MLKKAQKAREFASFSPECRDGACLHLISLCQEDTHPLKTILKYWLLIAVIVGGLIGLNYAAIQQVLRQGADNPQIQIAEDTAAKLASGQQLQSVVPTEQVDIASSLASYIIVFDASGKPIASSAQLNGQIPTLPSGVFDYVRQNGEDRITWTPQSGVREAIVVTHFKGANSGFVVAGRSLREAEKLVDDIGQILLVGWIGMLFVTFSGSVLVFRKPRQFVS